MSAPDLRDALRQMLAVLRAERQALAALDLEGVVGAAADKRELCGRIDDASDPCNAIDDECRGLAEAARRLNETNRQVRNLLAANVGARLEALTGLRPLYAPPAPAGGLPCGLAMMPRT